MGVAKITLNVLSASSPRLVPECPVRMAARVLAVLLPPSLASTAVLGRPRTREHVQVPEVAGRADGIVDASQTSLCMSLGCYADKNNMRRPPRPSSRERPQPLGSRRNLGMLVPAALIKNFPCW